MKSTEKVLAMLDQLQGQEDDEISEAVPVGIPPFMLRGALLLVAEELPKDPADLDSLLDRMGEYCLALRSDP